MDTQRIEKAVTEMLYAIGENPEREGLKGTPARMARMYEEIFSGIGKNPADALHVFFQEESHDEIVIVKDIPFYSTCEHHLLPFFGKAHVGYLPKNGTLTGLSKLARVVDIAAKKPQLQERLTSEIADALVETLDPQGVIVVLEAEHMCMTMRGIKKPGSLTMTSGLRGIFRSDPRTRAEAMALLGFGH